MPAHHHHGQHHRHHHHHGHQSMGGGQQGAPINAPIVPLQPGISVLYMIGNSYRLRSLLIT